MGEATFPEVAHADSLAQAAPDHVAAIGHGKAVDVQYDSSSRDLVPNMHLCPLREPQPHD